jgi:hypothetical protein
MQHERNWMHSLSDLQTWKEFVVGDVVAVSMVVFLGWLDVSFRCGCNARQQKQNVVP